MRHLLIALSFAWVGCTSPLNNPDNSAGDGGGSADGGGVGGGGGGDLAVAPDLGGSGAACKTACDCQPGLACFMGACTMSQLGSLYCCESATCPMGSYCQSMSGGYQMCGGGPIGPPDGGGMHHGDGGFHPPDGGFHPPDGGFHPPDFGGFHPPDGFTIPDGFGPPPPPTDAGP
jgi:hypothetical protein